MAVQNITHNTAGALTINAASGSEAFVTVNANVTALTVTNLPNGEVLTAVFELGATTSYTVNFAGYGTFNNWSNPGAVTVTPSNPVLGVFVQHDSGVRMTTPSVIGAGGGSGGGLPAGGTAGQIIVKQSATDQDAIWVDNTGGATHPIINLAEAAAPNNGTDDGPALKTFIDTQYAAGQRVFQFPPDSTWSIGDRIVFDGIDDITFIAYGATITHIAGSHSDMFKFLRCDRITWLGGNLIGRRDISAGASADDSERFMHYRSGSTGLTVRDVHFTNFGGAAISATAENTLFADLPSPTPVDAHTTISGCRLTNCHSLVNTKGGGFNGVTVSDIVATNGVGVVKIDGQQERGPAQSNEHPDYGSTGGVSISNIVGVDMNADSAGEHAMIQIEEDIASINVTSLSLFGSTNVAALRTTRGQTDKPTVGISISGLTASNVNYSSSGGNLVVINRGSTDVTINNAVLLGCDVYTASQGTARGYTVVNSSVLNGGQVRTFKGDTAVYNTQFWKGAATEAGPLAATDTTDVIETNGCRWDSGWAQLRTGSGTHYLGPGDTEQSGPTSARPASALPGFRWFDETLDRPVYRNAGNTGWVFSDGTAA